MSTPPFRSVQRGVLRAIAAGAIITAVVLGLAWLIGAWRAPEERVMSAATACLVLAAWIAAAVGRVALLRMTTPAAIDAARAPVDGDARVRIARAIAQNTLEQAVMAAPVYFGLAILADRGNAVLAAMVALFSAGRVLFWAGYARGAQARALGFALTFYPTAFALAALLLQQALRLFS